MRASSVSQTFFYNFLFLVNLYVTDRLKLPVPSGFIITTEACNEFLKNISSPELKTAAEPIETVSLPLPSYFVDEYTTKIRELEKQTGRVFSKQSPSSPTAALASGNFPLLLSVRTSSPIICAGLSQTILNLGMNDEVVLTLCNLSMLFHHHI